MSQRDAARARWRADLREFTSTALHSAELDGMAEEIDAQIVVERDYADLMDELAAAKAGDDNDLLKEVKLRVVEFRRHQRDNGAIRPGVVNNFMEPTDIKLTQEGY